MKCIGCNNEIKLNEKYCGKCGTPAPEKKTKFSSLIIAIIIVISIFGLFIGGAVGFIMFNIMEISEINSIINNVDSGTTSFKDVDSYIKNLKSFSEEYIKFFEDVELKGTYTEDELVKVLGYDDKMDLQDSCKTYLKNTTISNAMICFYDSNYAKTSTIEEEGKRLTDYKNSENTYDSVKNIVSEGSYILENMKEPLDSSITFKRYYSLSSNYITKERENISNVYRNSDSAYDEDIIQED